MIRASRAVRSLAVAAVALLLWCYSPDASFHAHTVPGVFQTAVASDTALTPLAQPHAHASQVSCCFGDAGGTALSANLSRPSMPQAHLWAALLSLPLLSFALRPPRPTSRRFPPHRASLVQQAVLIRI
jgi:hypothetical protein